MIRPALSASRIADTDHAAKCKELDKNLSRLRGLRSKTESQPPDAPAKNTKEILSQNKVSDLIPDLACLRVNRSDSTNRFRRRH
jgi:hypothetical protein